MVKRGTNVNANIQGELNLLEKYHALVTGNDFSKLRHPGTGQTIIERYPDLQEVLESESYKKHSTVDFCVFIEDATITHQSSHEWFLGLSPNLWPVIMRALLSSQGLLYQAVWNQRFFFWKGIFGDICLAKQELFENMETINLQQWMKDKERLNDMVLENNKAEIDEALRKHLQKVDEDLAKDKDIDQKQIKESEE